MRFSIFGCVLMAAATHSAMAKTPNFTPNISAILNGGYTVREPAFAGIANMPIAGEHAAGPKEGFWLDHTELAFSANVDDQFYGKISMVLADHDGETKVELEEAFFQTTALPAGFGLRGGRFLANVGYLNSKHPHTDSFVDRPLVNRAFLSKHYFDDGARLNWVAPTELYLELGVEGFKGANFPASSSKNVGASNAFIKTGGDIGIEHSWQLGGSWLSTDNNPASCSAHTHSHDEHAEHEEEQKQFCDFKGERNYYVADFIWKWAPDGNYKYQALTFLSEVFFVEDKGNYHHGHEHEEEEHNHDPDAKHKFKSTGWHASFSYQISPNWASGVRFSTVNPDEKYGDYTAKAGDIMLQYMPSHFSTVRLQYTRDESTLEIKDNIISLQYTMSLGDHGAHIF